jgi:hypothetical protein
MRTQAHIAEHCSAEEGVTLTPDEENPDREPVGQMVVTPFRTIQRAIFSEIFTSPLLPIERYFSHNI